MSTMPFQDLITKVIAFEMKAIDILMADMVEPLAAVGNPETLIGKSYEQWTPADIANLSKIYGTGNDTVLARLIFNREYTKVKNLEAQTGGAING